MSGLSARAALFREYLLTLGAEGDCVPVARSEAGAALGISSSTIGTAILELEAAGMIEREQIAGKPTCYRVTLPADPANPASPTLPTLPDSDPANPANPAEPRARHVRDRALETTVAVEEQEEEVEGPLPAGSADLAGSAGSAPLAGSTPIGQLAVAAACDAASAAGRAKPSGSVLGRLGRAAQQVAAERGTDEILDAARRIGEGAGDDLYTALRAVERAAPMPQRLARPAGGGQVPDGLRVTATLRLLLSNWPRAVFAVDVWEEKLAPIPEEFLLMAVDAIAKDGGEWPPTWGQVWKRAREIGVPIAAARRQERNRLRELERIAEREA